MKRLADPYRDLDVIDSRAPRFNQATIGLVSVLAVLTLPLIIVTLGFFYLVINIAMVALAEWIAPRFSIDGFWSYVGTVVVVWAVNWLGDRLEHDLLPSPRWSQS